MKELNRKIYILIFMVLITVPMFLIPLFININDIDIQNYEQRISIKLKSVVIVKGNGTERFTEWFNDHMPFRQDIISGWTLFLKSVNVSIEPDKAIIGKEGWLFIGNSYKKTIDKHRGIYIYQEDISELAEKVFDLSEYCKERDVGFLMVMVPDKITVFSEYLPDWFTTVEGKPYVNTLAEDLKTYLDEDKFLNLTDTMLDAKETYGTLLYPKTDTHWSSLGAYVGYSKIMDALSTDGVTHEIVLLKDYEVVSGVAHDIQKLMGIKKKIDDFDIEVSTDPGLEVEPISLDEDEGSMSVIHYVNDSALQDRRVLILRDSHTKYLIPYLTNTFSNLYSVHYNSIFEGTYSLGVLMDMFEPDILLIEVGERQLEAVVVSNPGANVIAEEAYNSMETVYVLEANMMVGTLQLKDIYEDSDGIHMTSSGNDPQFIMSGFDGGETTYTIRVDITVPDETIFDLFFSRQDNVYSSDSMNRIRLDAGKNNVFVTINSNTELTGIRIDPGMIPGDYIIHRIEIRRDD